MAAGPGATYGYHSGGPNRYQQQQQQQQQNPQSATEFDGKRLRKAIARKTVDHNTSIIKHLESRIHRRRPFIQPDIGYGINISPPLARLNPVECVTSKFVRTSTNKMRCPIFCLAWTPEGRRLITGASSGELTLWNGLTFNFETILQAHNSAVRTMVWSNQDSWLVTADHGGYVKYWQSNMNNVKMFQAHKEAVRGISFAPTDVKFVTCSDDSTVRVWDFMRHHEEFILRGHGADVKAVDWHPTKSIVVSGSKDNQQPVKLWDARTGRSLATIHAHKNAVMDVKWNKNGNWLLTASRDHFIKLFDIRNMSQECQVFRGHKKESCCLKWHPIHEGLFTSGGADGYIYFWHVGSGEEIGVIRQAHDSLVWCLDWHPLGHILTTGSNDHTCKFWTRNRPGDKMTDKYNLQTGSKGEEQYYTDSAGNRASDTMMIPGLETHQWDEDEYEYSASSSPVPGAQQHQQQQQQSESQPTNSNQMHQQASSSRDGGMIASSSQHGQPSPDTDQKPLVRPVPSSPSHTLLQHSIHQPPPVPPHQTLQYQQQQMTPPNIPAPPVHMTMPSPHHMLNPGGVMPPQPLLPPHMLAQMPPGMLRTHVPPPPLPPQQRTPNQINRPLMPPHLDPNLVQAQLNAIRAMQPQIISNNNNQ